VVFGFTILDTGIESFDKPSMTIYPNPAVDQISIDYSGEASAIVIADPMGRIVYQNRLNQAGLTVEIGNWASGLYTIRLDDGTSSVFEKK
jgi:hypothetical protein